MLKNELQEGVHNAPVLPPGQRRVTPEELTAALEALESSKQEQARQVQQTVAIGDVVEELGLNVTPEEVWEQVQAQRAQKAAPPPVAEPRQADALNETLHDAAQNARKLAGQASAAAMAAASEALTAVEQHRSQHRMKRRGGRIGVLLALLAAGWVLFSGSHGIMVTSDHATQTYTGNRGIAIVTGDNDAITLHGDCDTLVVLGDHDQISTTGTVKHIITPGDNNTITSAQDKQYPAQTIMDNGDGNNITTYYESELPGLVPTDQPKRRVSHHD